MKEYKVFLRREINVPSLKKAIRRNLKKMNIGQYVSITTKFMLDGNSYPSHSLGKQFILDLSQESNKKFYLSYLLEQFNTNYLNKHEISKVTGIYFEVLQTTKENYTNFIDRLNQERGI